jgi:hypothetical protein
MNDDIQRLPTCVNLSDYGIDFAFRIVDQWHLIAILIHDDIHSVTHSYLLGERATYTSWITQIRFEEWITKHIFESILGLSVQRLDDRSRIDEQSPALTDLEDWHR